MTPVRRYGAAMTRTVPGTSVRPVPLPLAHSQRIDALRGAPPARLEEFWADVARTGTPLVEPDPDDSNALLVTFVVRVPTDDPREVLLQANRMTDPARPRATVLRRVPGTDVAALTLRMPPDWRASYQFTRHAPGTLPETGPVPPAELRRHRAQGAPDPFARRQLPPRQAMAASSVVELPAAPPQPWRDPRPDVPAGVTTSHTLTDRTEIERRVHLHLAGADAPGGRDLVIVLDGDVWARQLPLAPTFDNLLADGAIGPAAVVLVEADDEDARWRDYTASPAFGAFVLEQLLPWARQEAPDVAPDPRRTTLVGQSLGGLCALWLATGAPSLIGNAVAQSPSVWWRDEELLTTLPARPPGARLRIQVGTQEWVLLEPTRRLTAALRDAGHDVVLQEYDGGHDHACWWGGIGDAVADLHGTVNPA